MGSLYSHNIDNEEPASETWTMTQIFQLDQELSDWQNGLSTDLSLLTPETFPKESIKDPIGERYRAILTLRFLNTKLLLHRPVFMRSLGKSSHQDHRRSFGEMRKTFNTSVVRCATESVTIVHTMLTSQHLGRHLLGAWWFTLFYVFHASLATFGSALIPVDQLEGGQDYVAHLKKVQQTLRKAVEAMPLLTARCSLIDQCVEYISQLILLVDGWSKSYLVIHVPSTIASFLILCADLIYSRNIGNLSHRGKCSKPATHASRPRDHECT